MAILQRSLQVYLSTRTGTWLVNRMQSDGMPRDMNIHRRYVAKMPVNWKLNMFAKMSTKNMDPALIGIKSSKPYGTTTVMINDDLSTMVMNGKVKVKALLVKLAINFSIFMQTVA